MTSAPVTIALTRYEEPSWLLDAALASLSAQQHVVAQVLVLDQSYDAAAERRCRALTSRCVSFHYTTIPPVGLSWARNHGIRRSETDILLFIDPDAVAEPTWAMELAATLSEPKVAVAGARILGAWHGRSPLLARANVVRDQYSLLDLGEEARPARKVVGTGFGIHRGRLGALAYFDETLGRRPGEPVGGEETDLCDRARRAGLRVYYNGRAVVHHQIVGERIALGWILRRLYYAGVTRARRGHWPQPTHRPAVADYVVAPLTLPAYVTGFAVGKLGAMVRRRKEGRAWRRA